MVDADHQAPRRPRGESGDGHARTAAEFEHAAGRLHVEKSRGPAVPGDVRRAAAHDPAGEVPRGAGRPVELGQAPVPGPPRQETAQHLLFDLHGASEPLRVASKSMSEPTPVSLSIGELAERTGVPATTLRYYDELGLVRPSARAA